MAGYQSIFAGAGAPVRPQAQTIAAGFTPGKYAGVNAQIAANKPQTVDPSTIKDYRSLVQALDKKQVNEDQFYKRAGELNKVRSPYDVRNLVSAIGNAGNQVLVKPVVAVPKSAYDIGRGAAASVTGNKKALENAHKAKATDEPQVLSPVTRPLVQLARTIDSPTKASTYVPITDTEKRIFGEAPIQNIQAGVKSNYEAHKGLNPAARILLAGGYGAGQLGQDTAALAGTKIAGESNGLAGALGKARSKTGKPTLEVTTPRSAFDRHTVVEGNAPTPKAVLATSKQLTRADAAAAPAGATLERPLGTSKNPSIPVAENLNTVPKPGRFKNLISVSGDLSRQGKSGKEIVSRLAKAEGSSEVGQAMFLKKIPSVTKLSGKDFPKFVDTLETLDKGKTPATAVPVHIQKAIDEWTKAIPEVRQRAEAAGVETGNLGPHYFPRNYTELLSTDKGLARAAKHLVDSGQAKTTGEAVRDLKFMKNQYSTPFGHFERSRTVDLPGYDKSKNALVNYVGGAYNKIGHAEQFGPKGEVADTLIGNIADEGRDADRALKNYQIATGQYKYHNPGVGKALERVRGFNRVTKLGLSSILNATQSTNTAAVTGIFRTAKAALKQLSPEERAYVDSTGVRVESVINNLRQQAGAAAKTKGALGKVLNAPGFGAVEKFNRGVAAVAGRDYAQSLAAKGTPRALKILRDELGVEGDIKGKLTPEQEVQASRKIVERTQFKTGAKDLPGWADSPMGKTVAQFRTFAYKQTGFTYNELIKKAIHGNPAPLLRFLAVGIPVGYAAGGLRNKLGGKQFDGTDTKGQSTARQLGGKAVQGVQNVGGLGLAQALVFLGQNRKSKNLPSYIAGDVGGPTAGLATSLVTQTSNKKSAERLGLGQVPVAGPYLKQKLTPYQPSQSTALADALSGDDSAKALLKQTKINPGQPPQKQRNTQLSDKQYQQFINDSNKSFAKKIAKAQADPAFSRLSTDDKKKTLARALSDARSQTLDNVLPDTKKKAVPKKGEAGYYQYQQSLKLKPKKVKIKPY